MPVCTVSEVRIQFRNKDARKEDLDQINQMLATMELTALTWRNFRFTLPQKNSTLNQGVVVDATYSCGLYKGTLVCRRDEAQKVYRYFGCG